jgi:predicted hotdog family 3-hydroxylacyl-ACP dehydratase
VIDRAEILRLVPQQGAMCLLDEARSWSDQGIACATRSHLSPANPLRRDGRLAILCGCEYGFQAAALHGALAGTSFTRPGYVARLQVEEIGAAYLDDPAHGEMAVEAMLELADTTGMIYGMTLRAEDGRMLLAARGTIMLAA